MRAGRDDDQAGAARPHVGGVQAHARRELEIGEPRDLAPAPLDEAAPGVEAGQLRDPAHAAADVVGGVDEPHALEAALGEHDRALEPGRPGAHHEHVAIGVGGALEALGMPAAAVLLARRRVLRAAQVAAAVGQRVAGVAADAGADLVVAALLDLERQERIGDRRARGADQVPDAALDHVGHHVGIDHQAGADDRLVRRLAEARRPLELVAGGEEARGAGVEARGAGQAADDAVEEVDERLGRAHEREALLGLDARAVERVGGDADRDRGVVADGLAHQLERLQPEARAVLERAAVGVGAVVVARREELRRQVRVRAVDVDDVEAGLARPQRRGHPVGLRAPDVGELHRLRHDERLELARDLARRERHGARLARLDVDAAVPQLDRGQRAVPVRLLGHEPQRAHVAVVPETRRDVRVLVALGVDRAVLRAHRRPAALGLDARGGAPASTASRRRSRCSAAPGRSGCAASSARSARGSKSTSWRGSRALTRRARACARP